jgi:3-hydroxybutyryl-CoA dehydrogenase
MTIKKVGVVGCGQMGGGITQVCAQSGYDVIVSEVNNDALRKGLAAIDGSLARSVQKEKITPADREAALARIRGTVAVEDFGDCDLVIEAATEDLELKKRVFARLDRACPGEAILATNTSCLSIADMAAVTRRPEKVMGLHFMNPVPLMKLLEVVKAAETSEATMETGKRFGLSLGKTIVIAQDAPGFIVNRLMVPQILIAIRMLEKGQATKEDIDTSLALGLNHPMGPLALADLVGLDTIQYIAKSIYQRLKDARYAVPNLLKKMVREGCLGRKTGRGFYDYKK